MPHYTLQSGVATVTVTLRCPVCRALRPVTPDLVARGTVSVRDLCCPPHRSRYIKRLMVLEIQAFAHAGLEIPSWVLADKTQYGALSGWAERYLATQYCEETHLC